MSFQLTKVIGHRGASGYAPENTLISMSKAQELGVKWVEFDVMLAGSGEPIIFHDLTLERTTNGLGRVAKTDYKILADLDCGSWFSKEYAGQKIPTLKNFLTYVANLNLAINVEIKFNPGQELITVKETIKDLKSHWPKNSTLPLISSFSTTVIEAVYKSDVECKLGYIIDSWSGNWQKILSRYQCISLHVDHNILTHERVKKLKDSGLLVLAYTVNDSRRALQLFDWGVDSVFTDYPDIILASL